MNTVTNWLKQLFERILIRIWAWLQETAVAPGGPRDSPQPTDNLMRTMNLVMPLKDKTAIGRAQAALVIGSSLDEIYSGLDNVGTVHMARFTIVDNNLLMFSFYDGDFHAYIRDFIMTLGNAFDGVVGLIEDPPPLPCWQHVDAFIEWVHQRDAFQLPDDPGTMIDVVAPKLDNLQDLSRYLVLQLDKNPNVQLGAYRAYPGYSVAQVRQRLGVGW
ncbi:hypothetical protein [Variovorax guangxiensis]|uniref:hypothetical protein n=1 Tax=Variovorax guangxiensis TaxID=1775474 RepID=UPI00285A2AE6|nr:hypothetical protein [Variovorax guangxiensis]MDR6856259.1 hypothetical protein [Variovorax guangxiensis]